MGEISRQMLEEMIKQVIAEQLSLSKNNFVKYADKSGVISVRGDTVKPERFDTGKEGDEVYLKDIFTVDESPRLGCGIMEMKECSFDWTLQYDEIDYIIEGTLEIVMGDRKVVGQKGDVMLIPKNTSIQFSSPDFCRFMYVVYPANWQEQ